MNELKEMLSQERTITQNLLLACMGVLCLCLGILFVALVYNIFMLLKVVWIPVLCLGIPFLLFFIILSFRNTQKKEAYKIIIGQDGVIEAELV